MKEKKVTMILISKINETRYIQLEKEIDFDKYRQIYPL